MKNKSLFNIFLIITILVIIAIVLINLIIFYPTQQQNTIKIGALFPLSGGLSQYGEVALNSAQLAAQEINEQGGINGKELIIDYQDHKCNPQEAVSILEQFSTIKNIKILTSATCSGTVLAMAPKLETKDSLLMGTIVTTPKISGVSPYVFRNWASDDSEAKLFANEIKKRGYKKIGVIHEETDYAKGLMISLKKYLNNADIEIITESYVPDATDMRTQLSKLKSEDIEMLFISPQTITSGDRVLKSMIDIDFKPAQLFVNDNVIKAEQHLKNYPELLENAIGADYVMDMTHTQEFLEKYKEVYGKDCIQPNICAGVYDAVNLLAQAIEENGYDVNKIKDYLETTEYQGITGTISFDENHDRDNSEYSLFIIKNGEAVLY